MKIRVVVFAISLILLASGAGWWLVRQHNMELKPVKTIAPDIQYKRACDIFTLADAATVLGQGAKQIPSHTDVVSAQKSLTTCLYSYDPGSFSDLVSASILLQGSTPAQAKQSFADAQPSNAQPVNNYGDKAYWDPDLGQLHILKGQYWLIISAGSGAVDQRDQDLPHKLADIIIKRL